jgi:hypothetical protein
MPTPLAVKMKTEMTVKVMLDAADEFEAKAGQLRKLALELKKTEDWSLTGEAISVCTNFANLRLDLFCIRPIRELERELLKHGG